MTVVLTKESLESETGGRACKEDSRESSAEGCTGPWPANSVRQLGHAGDAFLLRLQRNQLSILSLGFCSQDAKELLPLVLRYQTCVQFTAVFRSLVHNINQGNKQNTKHCSAEDMVKSSVAKRG